MKYRKRNPDGTLGDWVETPWSQEPLAPELQVALEAIVMMQIEIEELKAEIATLKGGEQA